MINSGQDLLSRFQVENSQDYYDPVILTDTYAGFSIRRNYPEDIRYKPAHYSDGKPDNVAVIWVVYDKKRVDASNPTLVPVRCRIATMSIYRTAHWDYDFSDDQCPSKDSVELSNSSPQPFSLDFPADYFYDTERGIFISMGGKEVAGIEILNTIFNEHIDSVHYLKGIRYKFDSLKRSIEYSFYDLFIKAIKILLKTIFGRTIEEDWKTNSAFDGYPISAFKKLQLSSIEIFGYRTSKNVIVVFCLLIAFASFVFLPLDDNSYLSSVLESEILTTIHVILILILLDEAIPRILFVFMNLLIYLRKKRLLSKL
jgi:hypothetical protein